MVVQAFLPSLVLWTASLDGPLEGLADTLLFVWRQKPDDSVVQLALTHLASRVYLNLVSLFSISIDRGEGHLITIDRCRSSPEAIEPIRNLVWTDCDRHTVSKYLPDETDPVRRVFLIFEDTWFASNMLQ